MKIAIYYIATSVYKKFFDGFYNSLENFFPGVEKKVILFTDDEQNIYKDKENIEWHYINHYPWPVVTMYKLYRMSQNIANDCDYHFHFNSNVIFKPNVDYNDLLLKLQTGKFLTFYHWNNAPYTNEFDKSLRYIQGAYFGGATNIFTQVCNGHAKLIDYYINNKHIVPAWHDETALNQLNAMNKDLFIQSDIHPYIELLEKNDVRVR